MSFCRRASLEDGYEVFDLADFRLDGLLCLASEVAHYHRQIAARARQGGSRRLVTAWSARRTRRDQLRKGGSEAAPSSHAAPLQHVLQTWQRDEAAVVHGLGRWMVVCHTADKLPAMAGNLFQEAEPSASICEV